MRVSVKGETTADRVLDLAESLAQTRGFHGFSYGDVATELGITRAALHYYFPSKAELGVARIHRYHQRFRARLDEMTASSSSPAQCVEQYAEIYRALFANGRMCLCGMLAAEFETLGEPLRPALVAFFDTSYDWLAATLTAGRDSGTIRFAGEARETAELVVSTLEGAMLVNRPVGNAVRFDDVVRRLLAQLLVSR